MYAPRWRTSVLCKRENNAMMTTSSFILWIILKYYYVRIRYRVKIITLCTSQFWLVGSFHASQIRVHASHLASWLALSAALHLTPYNLYIVLKLFDFEQCHIGRTPTFWFTYYCNVSHGYLDYMDRNEKTKVYNIGVNWVNLKRQCVHFHVLLPMYKSNISKIRL